MRRLRLRHGSLYFTEGLSGWALIDKDLGGSCFTERRASLPTKGETSLHSKTDIG